MSSPPSPATSPWGLGGFSWVIVCPHSHPFTRLSKSWPTSLQGPVPSPVQDLAFLLVEFHKVPVVPFLQTVSVLWLAALHLNILPDPLSLVSSENLVRTHSSTGKAIGQERFQNRHADTPLTAGIQVQTGNMTL